MGTHKVTAHRVSRRRKAYIQWGVAWFPKGIVNDTAISTPVPGSPQHDTFHLSEAHLQDKYHYSSTVTERLLAR
jgi:hypothetical protein